MNKSFATVVSSLCNPPASKDLLEFDDDDEIDEKMLQDDEMIFTTPRVRQIDDLGGEG